MCQSLKNVDFFPLEAPVVNEWFSFTGVYQNGQFLEQRKPQSAQNSAQTSCLAPPKTGPWFLAEWQVAEATALVHTLDGWSVVQTMVVSTKSPDRKLVFGKGNFQHLTGELGARTSRSRRTRRLHLCRDSHLALERFQLVKVFYHLAYSAEWGRRYSLVQLGVGFPGSLAEKELEAAWRCLTDSPSCTFPVPRPHEGVARNPLLF
ncbi:hypothetical protein H8959_017010 [Pygathrix nigripes]